MKPPRPFIFLPTSQGMALVVTLALLVLMLGLTPAFFSKVALDKSIRSASASRDLTSTLARSAVGIITSDLLQEIAAGSLPDDRPELGVPYFQPRTTNSTTTLLGSSIPLVLTPSMAPQNTVNSITHPTLIKESRNGQPGFVLGPGYETRAGVGNATLRASFVPTTLGFGSTRGIPAQTWEDITLGDTTVPPPSPPDWIYLDRSANTPVLADAALGNASSRSLTNSAHVIGRFAYRIYDVGGLLDLNALGDAASPAGNATRSDLGDLSLSPVLPGLGNSTSLSSFADWRAGNAEGPRPFLSRLDMVRTTAARGDLPREALQWFTLGGAFANSPAYRPNPNLIAASPASLEAGQLNPSLPGVRFSADATLDRGTDPVTTVPAGSSVMPRRFPLRKLDLLADPNTPAEDLTYYFGLQRQGDGSFRYTAADASGVIKDLAAVAAEGREPNFFEVLQAAIATGSLGRNAGNTYTVDHTRDGLRTRQTWQIGANIIDQWDADDFPTTIRYQVPATGAWEPVHGVENLPYFNSVAIMAYRPAWDRDRLQIWSVFDVWNPHQNATTPPAGIDSFRIIPRRGETRVSLAFSAIVPSLPATLNETAQNTALQSVVTLNAGRAVAFDGNATFPDPTLVGPNGPPSAPDWQGGLLLCDFANLPPAVPAEIHNKQVQFPALVSELNTYLAAAGLPTIGAEGGTFGAKAHNWFRLRSSPTDKVTIDLQYRKSPAEDWITYQSIDDFMPISSDPLPLTGGSSSSTTVTDGREDPTTLLNNTLLSENPSNTNSSFYGWRFDTPGSFDDDLTRTGFTMVKYDPRTTRFGHNELRRSQRGRTIRHSIANPTYPTDNPARDLATGWMMLRTGNSPYLAGVQNFFTLEPADAMQRVGGAFGSTDYTVPFGYIANIPEAALSATVNPTRYRDRDGVIRPGDGYRGAVPTAVPASSGTGRGSMADRPLVLNRPFRSVGEMGHAFRDLPWKSLDFFTRNSGDLGLLDVFSLDEETESISESKVNLNSAPEPVLAALLAGTGRTADGLEPIPQPEADDLARQIVLERQTNGPFATVGDLVSRVFSPSAHNVNGGYNPTTDRKAEREAAIRTLSAVGETRTWNLLIDLVVQPGRFSPGATGPSQFRARSENRYWVHLVMDRITGQTVQQRWESVNE